MAKFLKTTGVSHYLEQLIDNAQDKLILISPFLKFNPRIKSILEDKDRLKIDVRLIYGKNELQPEENNWLNGLKSIRSSFLKNLHAKCYLNETQVIITSMNLYEFSQVNNQEMGILINKDDEPKLYQDIYDEVMRLVRDSEEIEVTVAKIPKDKPKSIAKKVSDASGYCIRCKVSVKLNPQVPYCKKCFSSWSKYKDKEYKEKHCHICGIENPSTLLKPSCYPCYKSYKDRLAFPIG